MLRQNSSAELEKSLQLIIDQMQVIQKQIGSGSQPPSMHELDALAALGRRYADVLERFGCSLDQAEA